MMYFPADFGRPHPGQLSKSVAASFLNSSLYPVTTLDSNSIFKIKPSEFQFETTDGVYTPDFALKLPRTPLSATDPSTYISVSPFTENNIRKYHSSIGNLNHDDIKNPLSVADIKSQYKQDQLPLGAGVNPLASDYFKPVHLTPGCLAEVVSFDTESSPSASTSSFNLMARSNSIMVQRNGMKKLWGTGRKSSVSSVPTTKNAPPYASSQNIPTATSSTSTATTKDEPAQSAQPYGARIVPIISDLKSPESSLNRSGSSFLTKVMSTDSLNKKLSTVSELMVAAHGKFLNVINLNEDYSKIEIDVPYLRILFSVGVITSLSVFTSPKGQERSLDIVVGFSSGDLLWLNPFKMKYSRLNKNARLLSRPVTSTAWSPCGRFIYAGFSNGEIMVFSREYDDDSNYKSENNVRKSHYAKYYRVFEDKKETNPVAHFQLSHKAITAIKFNPAVWNMCCVTSDDGFNKLVDVSNRFFVSDITQSYYGGQLCAEFTKDGRFLFVGGEDDFISVYELFGTSGANIRLLARLEGSISWIRDIKVDYKKSETSLFVYRVSCVGDDGMITSWEFQPRNLPKTKRSLHHRSKMPNSPNLRSVSSGIFHSPQSGQQQQQNHHRRKVSLQGILSPQNGSTSNIQTRTRHSNSISSMNSGGVGGGHHGSSLSAAINSASQLSLSKMNSAVMEAKSNLAGSGSANTSAAAAARKSLSRDQAKWTPLNNETIVHESVGLSGVPILRALFNHGFELGRLSGIFYVGHNHVWTVTCGGDAVRWSRP